MNKQYSITLSAEQAGNDCRSERSCSLPVDELVESWGGLGWGFWRNAYE